jgi:hypothetical protein
MSAVAAVLLQVLCVVSVWTVNAAAEASVCTHLNKALPVSSKGQVSRKAHRADRRRGVADLAARIVELLSCLS